MSILCPFDMLIHGINIQLNGTENIDFSFHDTLRTRLIPVRSRVRISPLLFFIAVLRVIRRDAGSEEPQSIFAQVFAQLSWNARLPLARTIFNRSHSAQSVRSRVWADLRTDGAKRVRIANRLNKLYRRYNCETLWAWSKFKMGWSAFAIV